MVEIQNEKQLEAFLRGKPTEWGRVIAVRAALRVLPLWFGRERRPDLTLSIFRALFISRSAILWPARDLRHFTAAARAAVNIAAKAAAADDENIAYAAASSAAAAAGASAMPSSRLIDVEASAFSAVQTSVVRSAAAVRALMSSNGLNTMTGLTKPKNDADAAASAASAVQTAIAAAHAAVAAIWLEVEEDAAALGSIQGKLDAARNLLQTPLWSDGASPSEIDQYWKYMTADLLRRPDEFWAPWVEWYERTLRGEVTAFSDLTADTDEDFCLETATKTGEFWSRGVGTINSEIADNLNKLRFPREVELPPIPEQRPAMLQPEWQGDVLRLPSLATSVDPGADFVQVLGALRDDLIELADDADADRNTNSIDPRVIAYLRRLADRIPLASPTHYDVHRLGLAQSNLSTYLKTVVAGEWPDYLAARTLGTMHHFDRVMGQLPSWREFKRNAESDTETIGEVHELADKIDAFAVAISPIDVTVADEAISGAMRLQVDGIRGLEDQGLAFNKQLIAYDAREGARNTFKALAGKFLQWIGPGFKAEHDEFGEKLGRTIYRVLAAAAVGCGVTAATVATGHNLAEVAELVLKSPEALKFLDGSDGWVAGFLTFVAANFVGGKGEKPK